ncbi:MAG: hypothetical protein DSY80_02525 [Desulfocapsa sp.]|nr:MAG: hypothetical protein DSY80_02525 [Desulfocapsa sp.]
MPPKIPMRLYELRESVDMMWQRMSIAIDDSAPQDVIEEYAKAAKLLETLRDDIYDAWQKLGGQSYTTFLTGEKMMQEIENSAMERYEDVLALREEFVF